MRKKNMTISQTPCIIYSKQAFMKQTNVIGDSTLHLITLWAILTVVITINIVINRVVAILSSTVANSRNTSDKGTNKKQLSILVKCVGSWRHTKQVRGQSWRASR